MTAPATAAEFDSVYRGVVTPWGDWRIPPQLQALARTGEPRSVLELGCGVGRFSRYMARVGLRAVGVDFSEVAIAKARARVARDVMKPELYAADVQELSCLRERFDVSFDVGCFHCLDAVQQAAYVGQLAGVLQPGAIHLVWALDSSPSGQQLSAALVAERFASAFKLTSVQKSRRRLAASHWYWLQLAAE